MKAFVLPAALAVQLQLEALPVVPPIFGAEIRVSHTCTAAQKCDKYPTRKLLNDIKVTVQNQCHGLTPEQARNGQFTDNNDTTSKFNKEVMVFIYPATEDSDNDNLKHVLKGKLHKKAKTCTFVLNKAPAIELPRSAPVHILVAPALTVSFGANTFNQDNPQQRLGEAATRLHGKFDFRLPTNLSYFLTTEQSPGKFKLSLDPISLELHKRSAHSRGSFDSFKEGVSVVFRLTNFQTKAEGPASTVELDEFSASNESGWIMEMRQFPVTKATDKLQEELKNHDPEFRNLETHPIALVAHKDSEPLAAALVQQVRENDEFKPKVLAQRGSLDWSKAEDVAKDNFEVHVHAFFKITHEVDIDDGNTLKKQVQAKFKQYLQPNFVWQLVHTSQDPKNTVSYSVEAGKNDKLTIQKMDATEATGTYNFEDDQLTLQPALASELDQSKLVDYLKKQLSIYWQDGDDEENKSLMCAVHFGNSAFLAQMQDGQLTMAGMGKAAKTANLKWKETLPTNLTQGKQIVKIFPVASKGDKSLFLNKVVVSEKEPTPKEEEVVEVNQEAEAVKPADGEKKDEAGSYASVLFACGAILALF